MAAHNEKQILGGVPAGDDEVGRYRIQSVADMTGVSAATLRAWERRYGIPSPQRTASAYRLYSDRDIAMVRRVRDLCAGGMAPSQAAQIVLEVPTPAPEPPPTATPSAADSDVFALAVQRIIDAVDRFDSDQLEAAVKHSLYLGASVTVFERVLAPAMAIIGRRWQEGTLGIAQEHLASEVVSNAVRYILRLVQPELATRVALLACFADEDHLTPLHGIALRFAEWGFKTILLGARTPPHALRQAVAEVHPDIVGLSVIIQPPPYRARELLEGYAEACGAVPWIVGGCLSPELAELVTTHGGLLAPTDRQHLRQIIDQAVAARRTH